MKYEFRKAEYLANKRKLEYYRKESENSKNYSWKEILHILCSTYGWTIDYIKTLNIGQIKLILDGKNSCEKIINEKVGKRKNKDGNIETVNDMSKLPFFKFKNKSKKRDI